jgi:hypothetical protein
MRNAAETLDTLRATTTVLADRTADRDWYNSLSEIVNFCAVTADNLRLLAKQITPEAHEATVAYQDRAEKYYLEHQAETPEPPPPLGDEDIPF